MARSRDIRPEYFTDEKVGELAYGERLLFIGIWCHSDLRGVFEYSAKQLRVLIFPFDEGMSSATVQGWLESLERHGFIFRFEAEGKTWGAVRNWHHQVIGSREIEIWTNRPPPPGWQMQASWQKAVNSGIKSGRIQNDSRIILELTQNTTPSPSPSLSSADADDGRGRASPAAPAAIEDDPIPCRVVRSHNSADLQAMHPLVFIGRDERAAWDAVIAEYEWKPVDEACREIGPTLQGGRRILLSMVTGWLANHYRRVHEQVSKGR